ncbi:hypothetical protein [Roseibium sp. RKSG952]|uniref:hypothetical protein n=1 Tax=Roseibium sp. RKSG952 TaxID=2529384 RepID=UPI0012BBC0EA|nr:hypothetical protein [Roseibium sp. RKSG952]MTH99852.1 hypothetical protein [Roseibium sp. RKSG952]
MHQFLGHLVLGAGVLLTGAGVQTATAADPVSSVLTVPGRNTSVVFPSGVITNKDIQDPCVETVSRSGAHELVVTRTVGADQAQVYVDGSLRDIGPDENGLARIGSMRLARDGSLVHVRTWKSGARQVELVQDNAVMLTWPVATSVRVVQFDLSKLVLLVRQKNETARLVRYDRGPDGGILPEGEALFEFATCSPGSIRKSGAGYLVQIPCETETADLFYLDVEKQTLEAALNVSGDVRFDPVPRTGRLREGVVAVSADGSDAGLHFFYAVTGALLGQTGEPKSCASDAEGLQSWNQSYRLEALSDLYRKTGQKIFADLAVKSIRNTLGAQDGPNGRSSPQNPDCGWSSLVYSSVPGERLSLMINQAMIGNALHRGCDGIGGHCPAELQDEISTVRQCLAAAFEPDFDHKAGLYRISPESGFRFAGELAPWNWQISFAALIAGAVDAEAGDHARANRIVELFLSEWQPAPDGALWRYWPNGYFRENGKSDAQIKKQRYEDTGHAGITLQSLKDFATVQTRAQREGVAKRLDTIVAEGAEPARDLDGSGPKGPRWFPAGGWSSYASGSFEKAYARAVPGNMSADSIYTYASLFDPEEEFDLNLRVFVCQQSCEEVRAMNFDSAAAFLDENPFFSIQHSEKRAQMVKNQDRM